MRLITITEHWVLVSAHRLFISLKSQGSFHSVAHPISKVTQFYACSLQSEFESMHAISRAKLDLCTLFLE